MTDRLPQDYVPTNYDLFIHFIEGTKKFDANVTITFKKNKDSDSAYLNIDPHIHIKSITQNDTKLAYIVEYPNLIIFRSTQPSIDISSSPISIDYTVHPDEEEDCGFFVYEGCYFTDFEPNDAKTLLPCFDEPFAVATFSVRLRIPSELTSLTNMPIETIHSYEKENEIVYMKSPPMCTYLLCICVGLFSSIRGETKNGLPIEMYCLTGDEEKLRNYMNVAIFAIEWLEAKLEVKFELPHLQMIFHEAFESAMENYGLITFPDYTRGKYSNGKKLVIMHEIIHQWFGDLVSIKWWDSLWLNEGFANFIQYLILNDYDPKSEALEIFVDDEACDSLPYFKEGLISPPENEIDFENMFDSLIYSKGSFIVKMFYDIVGKDDFFKVCSNWIKQYKNKTVDISDFVSFVNSILNKDFNNFFTPWLKNVGFPALSVNQIVDDNNKKIGIEIIQVSNDFSIYQFKLPILYGKNGEVKKIEIFVEDFSFKVDVEFDWIIVNDNIQALCFVVYSKPLLNELVNLKYDGKLSENNSYLIRKSIQKRAIPDMIDDDMLNLTKIFK